MMNDCFIISARSLFSIDTSLKQDFLQALVYSIKSIKL